MYQLQILRHNKMNLAMMVFKRFVISSITKAWVDQWIDFVVDKLFFEFTPYFDLAVLGTSCWLHKMSWLSFFTPAHSRSLKTFKNSLPFAQEPPVARLVLGKNFRHLPITSLLFALWSSPLSLSYYSLCLCLHSFSLTSLPASSSLPQGLCTCCWFCQNTVLSRFYSAGSLSFRSLLTGHSWLHCLNSPFQPPSPPPCLFFSALISTRNTY